MTKFQEAFATAAWPATEPPRVRVSLADKQPPKVETRRERIMRLAREVSERDAEALAILAK